MTVGFPFGKKALVPSFIDRAALLFYLMIKDHPFQSGNKRIAMTSLFVLLCKNRMWLKVDAQELYNFTVWVAQSPARLKDETVRAVAKFLKLHVEKTGRGPLRFPRSRPRRGP